ncbi:MAG: MTAP family purine nucleoside phosphorylase [Magnetococcales bacterium]|nr:MTAP family purine nucleoside phosphorylase [Magnetococcales bacterium]
MSRLALIGGTSLLEAKHFQTAKQHQISTPHGVVTLLEQDEIFFLQRHGLENYTPPHRINHFAHMAALKEIGVDRILAIGSVGSLRDDLPPGTLVLPDDFYAPQVNLSFFTDQRGHIAPCFDASWRQKILGLWKTTPLKEPVNGGIYWQTTGPRFETPAEIRFHQGRVDLVGMTVASECILAAELKLPYAALCVVDNFANGLVDTPLSFDAFKQQVRANEAMVLNVVETLLTQLDRE